MKTSDWLLELLRLSLTVAALALLGMVAGDLFAGVAVGLASVMGWHTLQAFRLVRWMETREAKPPLFPSGIWRNIAQDVRARTLRGKKQRKRISRFYRRFRGATHAFSEAILLLGRGDKIEWCNPTASDLLGIPWPQSSGKVLLDLIGLPEVTGYLRRNDFSEPLEFSPANNKAMILSMTITPFGKKKSQRLVVARDITRIHNLDLTRRDFVANASHEFRTPLTVVFGYLEALSEDESVPEELLRPLELMRQQTQRMQNVVNDLLALSRLETDPTTPNQQPVNIPRLIRTVVEEAEELSHESGHHFETDLDASLWLKGTWEEFQSLFSNLIFNAIQHTPEKTRIEIRWSSDPTGANFSIQDNGGGIDERHIPRLTERFYRVDRARSRETGGTGLGLAIVKQILQRHGGELTIHSAPGVGTTFLCRFPASLLVDAVNGESP
jgi:two-component system phosphate regulon sensor histidine kinase PhoR